MKVYSRQPGAALELRIHLVAAGEESLTLVGINLERPSDDDHTRLLPVLFVRRPILRSG
ncbi:MAG TPA: hypothetical protein VK217_01210 [Acidimicrobiales bacterium]|nr:hypothetical protein [Acidimicrobiales bacterium]